MTRQSESQNNWSELLAGYVLGDLSPEDAISVKQYLEHHPEAIAEVEALQHTLALIPLGLPDVAPPVELKQKVLAAAPDRLVDGQALEQGFAQTFTSPAQTRAQRRWFATLGGIAAAMIAAFGIQSYQLQRELAATRQEMAQLRQSQESWMAQQENLNRYQQAVATIKQGPGRMLNLAGSGMAQNASGNVIISPQQGRAVLMLQNMPKPPEGKIYHLWALVGNQKIACIQFTPESDGKVLMELSADRWTNAGGVAITIEPMQSDAQPTGEMIMTGTQI